VALGRLGVSIARARRAGPGREAARRLVATRMGELRGLPQKIGQMLSLSEIESGAALYTPLAESTPAAPATDSFRWIAESLGAPLSTHFRVIARKAAAASLGQVHRATLHDGREVAVKVQYTQVAGTIDADLAALGVLAAPVTLGRSGFDVAAYRSELGRSLRAELDYTAEAAALRRFAAWRGEVPGVMTPAPIDALCTPRVLTMTWVSGDTVASARQWPWTARADAVRTLVRVFLRGCFVWRELHADPHAGNLRFLRRGDTAEVGISTSAARGRSRPRTRRLVAARPHDRRDDRRRTRRGWADLGFPPEVTDRLQHRLRAVTAILFEPWLTPVRSTPPPGRWRTVNRGPRRRSLDVPVRRPGLAALPHPRFRASSSTRAPSACRWTGVTSSSCCRPSPVAAERAPQLLPPRAPRWRVARCGSRSCATANGWCR
jgi:predicted unusual protein kinase regulating ubiquinone biosynthesis (AarF/ABC1/UbiB family)